MTISIDLIGADEVRTWLRSIPPSLRSNLRREIRTVAGPLVQEIKTNASWSTRIPGAVKVRTGFGARSSGVTVYVDAKRAPHARPLEFGNAAQGAVNRHQVFGHADRWTNQPTRPFFFPAVRKHAPAVRQGVQKAITDTLRTN